MAALGLRLSAMLLEGKTHQIFSLAPHSNCLLLGVRLWRKVFGENAVSPCIPADKDVGTDIQLLRDHLLSDRPKSVQNECCKWTSVGHLGANVLHNIRVNTVLKGGEPPSQLWEVKTLVYGKENHFLRMGESEFVSVGANGDNEAVKQPQVFFPGEYISSYWLFIKLRRAKFFTVDQWSYSTCCGD